MTDSLSIKTLMTAEQNESISKTVQKERKRLFDFIRKRVPEEADAEDILQDVFYQFTETYRLMKPVEQVSSWLFTVARNKITDWFRKGKAIPFSRQTIKAGNDEEGESLNLGDILPDVSAGPEGSYAKKIIMSALEDALEELPEEQRDVFVMHELQDMSFKDIAAITGAPVPTLISRKRYAVLHLRERLQELYTEFINQ